MPDQIPSLATGYPVCLTEQVEIHSVFSLMKAYPLPEPVKLEPGVLYMMWVDEEAEQGGVREATPAEQAQWAGWPSVKRAETLGEVE